jgi:hypothetical protein
MSTFNVLNISLNNYVSVSYILKFSHRVIFSVWYIVRMQLYVIKYNV